MQSCYFHLELKQLNDSVGEAGSGLFTEELRSSAAPPRDHQHKLLCDTKEPRQSRVDLSSHFSGRLHAVLPSVTRTPVSLLGIYSQLLQFMFSIASAANRLFRNMFIVTIQ